MQVTTNVKTKAGKIIFGLVFAAAGVLAILIGTGIISGQLNWVETMGTVIDNSSLGSLINFTVDSSIYHARVENYYPIGQLVKIWFNPNEPAQITDSAPGAVWPVIIVGVIFVLAGIFASVASLAAHGKSGGEVKLKTMFQDAAENLLKSDKGQPTASSSSYQREVAANGFLLLPALEEDNAKQFKFFPSGKDCYLLQDENDHNVFQAKKSPGSKEYVFIDFLHDASASYSIGKVLKDRNAPSLESLYFRINGKNVWDYLAQQGITVSVLDNDGQRKFAVIQGNYAIGEIAPAGKYIIYKGSERFSVEDLSVEEGYFLLRTSNDCLEPVFMALFALAYTGVR